MAERHYSFLEHEEMTNETKQRIYYCAHDPIAGAAAPAITLKGELYAKKTICTLHDIPTAPADDRSNVCGGQFFFRCCPGRALWEGAEIAPSHTICRNANFMPPAP